MQLRLSVWLYFERLESIEAMNFGITKCYPTCILKNLTMVDMLLEGTMTIHNKKFKQ